MTSLLLLAALIGPLPESKPTLELRIHVGMGREGDIVRAELGREDPWFAAKRFVIRQNYWLVVVESIYRGRPVWQIGKADERREFPPGAFGCSGSFMRTLESIAEVDQWERHQPEAFWQYVNVEWRPKTAEKPVPFPAVREQGEDE